MYGFGTDEYEAHYRDLLEKRLELESQPYIFLTPEWCAAFEALVQNDGRYKQVAKNWEGSVVLVFQTDEASRTDGNIFVYLDLWHGECRWLKLVPEVKGRAGDYILEAEYGRWERIVKGELNVVKELATRQLKLVPFDFKKAVKLAAASQAAIRLVELAGKVETRFPGELDDGDLASFKELFSKLRSDFGI
jgi:putative sterol carrier protein